MSNESKTKSSRQVPKPVNIVCPLKEGNEESLKHLQLKCLIILTILEVKTVIDLQDSFQYLGLVKNPSNLSVLKFGMPCH